MSRSIPSRCRGCASLHTGGIKNGRYDRWCCHFSNVASKVQAQCVQSGAYRSLAKNTDTGGEEV